MAKGIRHKDVGPSCTYDEFHAEDAHYLAFGTSFPASPSEGDLFYRTDLHILYIHQGTKWNRVQDIVNGAWPFDVATNSKSGWWGDNNFSTKTLIGEYLVNKKDSVYASPKMWVFNSGDYSDVFAYLGCYNVLRGKTATAVGFDLTAMTSLASGVDDDLTTATGQGKSSKTAEDLCYYEVDYGSVVSVKGLILRFSWGIVVDPYDNNAYVKIKISEDGVNWTTIYDAGPTAYLGITRIDNFGYQGNVNLRYVRITVWRNAAYTGKVVLTVYEVAAYKCFDKKNLPSGLDNGSLLWASDLPTPVKKTSSHAVIRRTNDGGVSQTIYYSDPVFVEE